MNIERKIKSLRLQKSVTQEGILPELDGLVKYLCTSLWNWRINNGRKERDDNLKKNNLG